MQCGAAGIDDAVVLDADIAAGLWPISIDPDQLNQVLMNLVVNARDALPEGGTVTIGVRNVSLKGDEAMSQGTEPGEHVALTVSDEGVGMDVETLGHLFEPFYTTKRAGKGTGLGLATVYGMVEQSGGRITVESQLGAGTTFTVTLPRASEQSNGGVQGGA